MQLGFIIGLILFLFFIFKTSKDYATNLFVKIILHLLIFVAAWYIFSISSDIIQYQHWVNIYNNHQYGISEGRVKIHNYQQTFFVEGYPVTVGEKQITIGNKDFFIKDTYNRFGLGALSGQNILKPGAYVRVYYIKGEIIRVDSSK